MKSNIISKPHKCLTSIAKEVDANKIQSPEIQNILSEMKKELSLQEDGVALAAPQIDVSLRIFVVAKLAYRKNSKDIETVFINPKIFNSAK